MNEEHFNWAWCWLEPPGGELSRKLVETNNWNPTPSTIDKSSVILENLGEANDDES